MELSPCNMVVQLSENPTFPLPQSIIHSRTIYMDGRWSSEEKPPSNKCFEPLTPYTLGGPGHTQVATPGCPPAVFIVRSLALSNPCSLIMHPFPCSEPLPNPSPLSIPTTPPYPPARPLCCFSHLPDCSSPLPSCESEVLEKGWQGPSRESSAAHLHCPDLH